MERSIAGRLLGGACNGSNCWDWKIIRNGSINIKKQENAVGTQQIFNPVIVDDVPEITPEDFKSHLGHITLIDVRRPEEFNGELSHIPGAKLITLGTDLDNFLSTHDKDDEIVFVCRSGARSGRATLQSRALGFSKSVNLQGGMVLWNERKYPIEKVRS